MGAVPKHKTSSYRKGKRRAAFAENTKQVAACSQCGKPTLPHQACKHCGFYKK